MEIGNSDNWEQWNKKIRKLQKEKKSNRGIGSLKIQDIIKI